MCPEKWDQIIIDEYPKWYGGYHELGEYYIKKKDWSLAYKFLQKALTLDEQQVSTYLKLIIVAYELRYYDEIPNYYTKAFKLDFIKTCLARRSSACAVIVYTNKGIFKAAGDILKNQERVDKKVHEYKSFHEVKKYYEEELRKHNVTVEQS